MHPHLAAVAASQCGVFTNAQAADAGYTESEVRQQVKSGRWVRMRRGVLTDSETYATAGKDPRSRHLLKAAAVLVLTGRDAWLSHRSAARAWSLPVVGLHSGDVAVSVAHQHRRRSPGVEFHTAVTPQRHCAVVDGLPVTAVARTVSDIARSEPFAHAMVTADAALQRGACTVADLEAVVRDCPTWPGIARTKRVLEFADRRSESPGETLSRVAIAKAGLPVPELQVELLLGGRRLRVDFMWPSYGLVGEFDGRVKYGRADDLWDEKLREDLIRRHGNRVARWTWDDVYPSPAPMLAIVRRALGDC